MISTERIVRGPYGGEDNFPVIDKETARQIIDDKLNYLVSIQKHAVRYLHDGRTHLFSMNFEQFSEIESEKNYEMFRINREDMQEVALNVMKDYGLDPFSPKSVEETIILSEIKEKTTYQSSKFHYLFFQRTINFDKSNHEPFEVGWGAYVKLGLFKNPIDIIRNK